MNVSSFIPFRWSKRAVVLFATLTPGVSSDFASFAAFPQAPVLRDFADLPRSAVFAQEEAPEWDALLERHDGWLAADGIYSVELGRDAADKNAPNAVKIDANSPTLPNLTALTAPTARKTLFLFSDTFGGSTKNAGRDFGERTMTNHSFAVLTGTAPNPANIAFFWRREAGNGEFAPTKQDSRPSESAQNKKKSENSEEKPTLPERLAPHNPLGVDRWLQDGVVWRGRVWTSALLVGAGWKPERVDAVSLGLDSNGSPDFNDVRLDETAPLSFKTEKTQVVFGAAICDDAEDGFLYVFGYLDRFDVGSRKDLVVARAPRASFDDFSTFAVGRRTSRTRRARKRGWSSGFRRSFPFQKSRAARTRAVICSFTRRALSGTKSRSESATILGGRSVRKPFFTARRFRANSNAASAVTTRKRIRRSATAKKSSSRTTSTA